MKNKKLAPLSKFLLKTKFQASYRFDRLLLSLTIFVTLIFQSNLMFGQGQCLDIVTYVNGTYTPISELCPNERCTLYISSNNCPPSSLIDRYDWYDQTGTLIQTGGLAYLELYNDPSQSLLLNNNSNTHFEAHNLKTYNCNMYYQGNYVNNTNAMNNAIDFIKFQWRDSYVTPWAGLNDDDVFDFQAPNMGHQEVKWYRNLLHCGTAVNLVPCPAQTPNPTYEYLGTGHHIHVNIQGGREYEMYYTVNPDNSSNCAPIQSGNIVVRIPYKLQIFKGTTTSNGTMLDMDIYTQFGGVITNRYPNYRNFKWYRNGIQIIGATGQSYNVTLPGDYYMIAMGDCGSRTSNTITFDCTNKPWSGYTTYTNKTFTVNTTVTGNFYVIGTMTIDPGVTVNIQNGVMLMDPCSDILIKKGTTVPNKNGGILNF